MIVGGLWEKEKQTTNQQIFRKNKSKQIKNHQKTKTQKQRKKNNGLNQKRVPKQTQYEERQGEISMCNCARWKQDSNRKQQEEKKSRHWGVEG